MVVSLHHQITNKHKITMAVLTDKQIREQYYDMLQRISVIIVRCETTQEHGRDLTGLGAKELTEIEQGLFERAKKISKITGN